MKKIPKTLRKGPFTYKQALAAGLNLRSVRKLVTDGQCYTVAKGIYMPSDLDYNEENQFKTATLIVGQKSAICLLSALSIYGLTDQIPRQTWVIVPGTKRTQERSLKILRMKDPQWDVGINKKSEYSITSVERTIVEAFFYKRMLGTNVAVESLREGIRKKLTTASKVIDMAKKLGCVHRLLPYLEAMA